MTQKIGPNIHTAFNAQDKKVPKDHTIDIPINMLVIEKVAWKLVENFPVRQAQNLE